MVEAVFYFIIFTRLSELEYFSGLQSRFSNESIATNERAAAAVTAAVTAIGKISC